MCWKMDLLYLFLFLQRNCRRKWSWVSIWSSVGTHPCNVRLKWSHECRGLTCLLLIDGRKKYSCIVPKSSISSSQLSWKCCNLINRAIAKPLSWFLPLSNAYLHVLGDPISWLWPNIKGIFVNSNIELFIKLWYMKPMNVRVRNSFQPEKSGKTMLCAMITV